MSSIHPLTVLLATLLVFAWESCLAGTVTYSLSSSTPNGEKREAFFIKTTAAQPVNLSTLLDQTGNTGNDFQLNISPDGRWMVMNSERFNASPYLCANQPCIVVMKASAPTTTLELVKTATDIPLHSEGFNAISSTGRVVVYECTEGAHIRELCKTVKSLAGPWSAPTLLTAGSTYDYNSQPAISADGTKVLFDCGMSPYAGKDSAICEVNINGREFRTVVAPANIPPGFPAGTVPALHHADYMDGGIVLEADWGGERVWRLSAGTSVSRIINKSLGNDNSPCVLPSGEIASLWLNSPNNPNGYHELKLMTPFGVNRMLVEGIDIADVGLGCGK